MIGTALPWNSKLSANVTVSPFAFTSLEDDVARLAGHLGLCRAGERGAVLLEGEGVLLLADLRVELRAPRADCTLRSGDARREGEQQNQVALHVAVLR